MEPEDISSKISAAGSKNGLYLDEEISRGTLSSSISLIGPDKGLLFDNKLYNNPVHTCWSEKQGRTATLLKRKHQQL